MINNRFKIDYDENNNFADNFSNLSNNLFFNQKKIINNNFTSHQIKNLKQKLLLFNIRKKNQIYYKNKNNLLNEIKELNDYEKMTDLKLPILYIENNKYYNSYINDNIIITI